MEKNFDADSTDQASLRCITCESVIPDGKWFARFTFGAGRVAVCRPWCLEKFLDNPGAYAARAGVMYLAELAQAA